MSSPDIEKGGAFQPASPTSHNSQPPHEGTDAKHDSCSIISEASLSPVEEEKSPKEPFPAYERETDYESPVVVHRSKRRGLFGQLTLLAEVENPKTFPRRAKWFITFITAVSGAAAPMGSSIFFRRYTLFHCCCASRSNLFFRPAALSQVSKDMHTTSTITNMSIALYMLSMSIFPLWWSSFSEILGRRTIYLVSFSLFVVFNVLSAVSNSIAMLIVMRMLSGGASASVQAVGAGTIADIWDTHERGRAMGIFYLGPLCGPLFAPIIGGALSQRWGWRSTMWFLVIYGGVNVIFILLALPETLVVHKPAVSDAIRSGEPMQRQMSRVSSRRVAQWTTTWLKRLKVFFLDPLKIVLYLRHPPVLLTVYYASVTFGSLYVLNVSVQETFGKPPYNFSTIILGLLYIPNSLGYVFSSIFGGRWIDRIMQREARKANRYDESGKLVYRPEDRMRENAWLGAFLYPAGLLWYGWTADKGVFWLVPV